MTSATSISTASYLIVFLDFTFFDRQSQRIEDVEIAETLDTHYQRVARAVKAAGGRVIKFIGDATLLVFPESVSDAGVRAILDLIESEDRLMEAKGWECRLQGKAHAGSVAVGEFGPDDERRFDIFGRAVNATARLQHLGRLTVSADAYGRLSPELRRRFRQLGDVYVTDPS